MKIFQLGIFVLLVTVMVSFCAAEDQEIINELCRFRIATIPHPNPELCHLYVQCQVNFEMDCEIAKKFTLIYSCLLETFVNALKTTFLLNKNFVFPETENLVKEITQI